jgi:hypothetical protein
MVKSRNLYGLDMYQGWEKLGIYNFGGEAYWKTFTDQRNVMITVKIDHRNRKWINRLWIVSSGRMWDQWY